MGSLWLLFAAGGGAEYLGARIVQPRQTRPLPNSRVDKFGTSKGYSPPILDVPPPAFVQDITGHAVELPRAVTAAQAQACVAAWGRLNATNLTVVGNRQTPQHARRDLTALAVMTLRWRAGRGVAVVRGHLRRARRVRRSHGEQLAAPRALPQLDGCSSTNPRWKSRAGIAAGAPRHLYHASPTCNESDDDVTALGRRPRTRARAARGGRDAGGAP